MSLNLIELTIVLAGLAFTFILFYRIPVLPGSKKSSDGVPSVSVIIPARNEEHNIPLLLDDLSRQTLQAYEIICADDDSDDTTAQIAESYGAKCIALHNKPTGWTGKTWACQQGADASKGDLLLFLDADVRLGKDGLQKLMQAYSEQKCAVSVQPRHKTEKFYEQFSLIFNLVLIAANGTALPKPHNIGLYGPVILIARRDYTKAGGHESVRKSVAEDMVLGSRLKRAGIPYRLFIGDEDVAFRMYSGGFSSLLQGWVKNLATGAAKTPPVIFTTVFFWIASLVSVPFQFIKAIIFSNTALLIVYSLLYIAWVFVLFALSKQIGRFQLWAVIFFPLLLLVFLGVFAVSAIKKAFGFKVIWKGRAIDLSDKT